MVDKVLLVEMLFSVVYYSDCVVSMCIWVFIDFFSEYVKIVFGGVVREV